MTKFNKNYDEDYDFYEKPKQKQSYVKNNNQIILTKEQKAKEAENIKLSKIDNKYLFGYKGSFKNKEVYYKYDKNFELLVIYDDKKILQVLDKTIREYESEKWDNYIDEII